MDVPGVEEYTSLLQLLLACYEGLDKSVKWATEMHDGLFGECKQDILMRLYEARKAVAWAYGGTLWCMGEDLDTDDTDRDMLQNPGRYSALAFEIQRYLKMMLDNERALREKTTE